MITNFCKNILNKTESIHKIHLNGTVVRRYNTTYRAPSNMIETDGDLIYYHSNPLINIFNTNMVSYPDENTTLNRYRIYYNCCTLEILGVCHRTDGPAIITKQYNKTDQYFIEGKELSKEEWFDMLTSEQKYNYIWNINEFENS